MQSALSLVRGSAAPAEAPAATRWTVVTVPAPGSESRRTIALLSKNERAPARTRAAASTSTRTPIVPALDEPVADPDADWYAAPEEVDHSTQTFAEAHPGVVRGVPRMRRLPVRDAGSPDWYDSLSRREADPADAEVDVASPSLADVLLERLDAAPHAARSSRGVATRSSGSPRATGARRASRPDGELAIACAASSTQYRLVKLEPSVAPRAPLGSAAGAPAVRGLPSPADSGAPTIVLASLGSRLPGAGTTEYPGLAAPRPESTPRPTSFCPIGTVEKKSKSERWCTRADKGGVSFREGPVAFLDENGKKRAVGAYVGGSLQGPFVEYGSRGTKIGEGTYKNGKKAGAWTFWWDNGKKQSQGAYVAGERTGLWTYYDEKGRKTSQGELRTVGKVEKKQGRWTFWHANGTKSQEGTFREGKKDGAWKTYDEKGRQLAVLVFRDGDEESR